MRDDQSNSGQRSEWLQAPIFAVLGGICGGSLLVVGAAPLLGILLLLSTLALVIMVFAGRRRAVAALAESIEEVLQKESHSLFRDEATGLPNHRKLVEQVPREVARAERYGHPLSLVAVVMPGLDQLRVRWGADMADRAVLHVAGTLKRIVRDPNMVFRLDGGQFAVLCQGRSGVEVAGFCEAVELAVGDRPIVVKGGLPLYVTVETSAVEYERDRFEGPLEFLSAARCEVAIEDESRPLAARADARNLRRKLVSGYESSEDGAPEAPSHKVRKAV